MRDRDLVPAAVVGVIVCCGATALIGGTVGGVALAAGQLAALSAVGLGLVVFVAWRLDRRRRCLGRTSPETDRSAHVDETRR